MMKKNLFFLLMAFFTLSFTACKDDDDKIVPSESVAGIYKGSLTVALGNEDQAGVPMNQNIYITKVDADHVDLSIKNFEFLDAPIGDIVVKNIPVVENGDGYTLLPAETNLTLASPIGEVKVSLTSGTIKGGELTLKIKVYQVSMELDIFVGFTGSKLTGSENSEAKILKFNIDSKLVVSNAFIGDSTITIFVGDSVKLEQLKFKPVIEVSASATVTPASGVEQDFSEPVVYTVTAQNGMNHKYTVSYKKLGAYSFEEDWAAGTIFDMPVEISDTMGKYEQPGFPWATSNEGACVIYSWYATMGLYQGKVFPVAKTADAKVGTSAVQLTTINTTGLGSDDSPLAIPKVTSGSMYLGTFEVDLSNTLKSTKFGIPFTPKPLRVTGYYKYTPGTAYYYCPNPTKRADLTELKPDMTDECSMTAVLYEVPSYEDTDVRLDGTNLYIDADNIIARAALADGSAKADFTEFNLVLNYIRPYNPAKLYRFAVVFSSSKNGDKFSGAPGSKLIIDDVKVISE